MLRRIKQWLCQRRWHPFPTTTVPIVSSRPFEEPECDVTFCAGCGAKLYTEWTDNAGTERRYECPLPRNSPHRS